MRLQLTSSKILAILLVALILLGVLIIPLRFHNYLPAINGIVSCYTCSSPPPFIGTQLYTAYFKFKRQTQEIAQALYHMALNARDSGESRAQLKDMACQMEARLNLMSYLVGEAEHRRARLLQLADLLQYQLHQLQYPADCTKTKFVTARLPACGLGCQVHHVSLALHRAFALNRTLLIQGNNWFDGVYPITNCREATKDAIFQPVINMGDHIGPTSPPALRRDWAEALKDTHSVPYAWFRGQLIRFILRLKPTAFKESLEKDLEVDKAISPLIGVHVRRTDKLKREAKFVPLSAYMDAVDWIFRRLEIERDLAPPSVQKSGSFQRTVYLASDDPDVFKEAHEKYSSYRYLGEIRSGSHPRYRSSQGGLQSIMYDVFRLANCDYVVCTFSSNVCRLVYELIVSDLRHYGDRGSHVVSVDVPYNIHGQRNRTWTVITNSPIGEAKRGDVVGIAKDFLNGSIQTDRGGILPAYGVEENLQILPDDLS